MYSAEVLIDLDKLIQIQDAAEQFPAIIDRYVRKDLVPFIRHWVDTRLRVEPGPVVYPIKWTSERQRRYYFGVIAVYNVNTHEVMPYKRTHQLIHDWHVYGDYKKGFRSVRVVNDNPVAQYVFGDEKGKHQQKFHRNTGWARGVEQLQALALATDDRIDDGWGSSMEEMMLAAA